MPDYASVTDIYFDFQPHSGKSEAHVHLNNLYSTLLDRDGIFVSAYTDLHDDADLFPAIRKLILDNIVPHATQTSDTKFIANAINQSPLSVSCETSLRPIRLTQEYMYKVLDKCLSDSLTEITIHVGMNHINFIEDIPLTYLDWEKFSTRVPARVAPTAALTAADIAAAVAGAVPAPIDPVALGTALSAAMSSVTITTASAPSGASSTHVTLPFNPTTLPRDVRNRYEAKLQGTILTQTNMTAFAPIPPEPNGLRYHNQVVVGTSAGAARRTDNWILADGTLYVDQTPNEKGLFKSYVTCLDDNHAAIREWYLS